MNTQINSGRKSISAFTLIELLVVISIISLLMAVLLPSLAAARETAMWSRNQANLKQILLAAINYAGDNREDMMATRNNVSGYRWPQILRYQGYINDKMIFWSPMRDTRFVFLSPMSTDENQLYITPGYSYNRRGVGPESSEGKPRNIGRTKFQLSKILAFGEQFDNVTYYIAAQNWRDGAYSIDLQSISNNAYFTWRGNAVQGWLDGHVKSADSNELYWQSDTDQRNGVYTISNLFGLSCLPPYYDMRASNNANLP